MKLRLGDCELVVGYEAVAALTAVLLLDRENRVIGCIAAALLHELGHILMMRRCRVRLKRVRLRLFDVLIEAGEIPTFSAEVRITLGGVMMNFFCAAILYPLAPRLSIPHLALGVFNLLPVMSLDGGHLLYLFLSRHYQPRTCERVLRITTFVLVLPLFAAGIYLLFRSSYNYSLLAISLYLLAILFLKN